MNNWTENLLSNHVSLITKGTTPTSLGKSFKESGINFIKAESITEAGEFILDSFAYIDEETHELLKRSQLHDGDILFSIAGVLGRIAIVNSSILPANTNQAIALIRLSTNTEIESDFLKYFLNSEFIKEQIRRINVQSAQANFSLGDINRLVIKYPKDKPEQRQIATILSTADAVIEKTQAAIAKYKAIKQGMLQDLFTRGIDTTTGKLRPSYQDAPELYKESKLGWIPKEWDAERIDKLCQITTGNKDTQNKLEYGEHPFFVRSQTIERINSYSYDGEAILTAGDGVGVGKIYHYINGKFDFHQRVYMLYEFEKIIAPKYLFYYFSTNFLAEVDRCSAKTTVDSVRMEMIAGMIVPLPNISEQISIADKLITLESKLKTEQDFLHKQQQIKAGLMNDLLSGKKKVKVKEGATK
jgi:type I restriction enzyme S subunit